MAGIADIRHPVALSLHCGLALGDMWIDDLTIHSRKELSKHGPAESSRQEPASILSTFGAKWCILLQNCHLPLSARTSANVSAKTIQAFHNFSRCQ